MTKPAAPAEPAPPLDPSAAGERVYRDLLKVYGDDPETRHLARTAADAWARLEEARAQLALEGLTVRVGKEGRYAHPSIKTEVASRAGFLAALKVLRQPTRRSKTGRRGLGEVMAEGRQWVTPSREDSKTMRYITRPPR